jgi:hypothetical protein
VATYCFGGKAPILFGFKPEYFCESRLGNQINIFCSALILNRPVLINSATGFINTFVNVYTKADPSWSILQIVTASVTGGFMLLSGICFIIYQCRLCLLKEAFTDEIQRKETQQHRST